MPVSASMLILFRRYQYALEPSLRRWKLSQEVATHWWKGSGRGSRADTCTRPRWPVTKDTPSHSDPPSAIFTEINSFSQRVKHSPSFSAGWATEHVARQKKWPVENEKSPSKEYQQEVKRDYQRMRMLSRAQTRSFLGVKYSQTRGRHYRRFLPSRESWYQEQSHWEGSHLK